MPNSFSSAWMARETEGCETCSASAARVMFLYRQAAQKYWS